ncbi:excinuclease ABC subunit C [Candidatus Berkelbacteria bacterium CG23_combo_of_CG06-09_8_20_14_all_41_73]|uniref:Excinuclease ABC subunit C n=2 Tax=Candidatus Berkelbacteria TaxID=1618330 RepID=A0A2H0B292_9BACT|nr:MAG: excinuclease ABC subunit C [Candidatus Berkelbacteria bacterium CG23_combo_of_CG06-09_8_20_14_all_41_73]PIZ27712.1 MAG: excinuclease ABC subunit C [Candidatus Berkelbacteria bacterium CG_4_10_14_0_8_um_filter_42_34]
MYYVYILFSTSDRKFYTGYTSNLKIRISKHHEGKVISTSKRKELKLIYYEAYLSKIDARRNEKYYKTTKGKQDLRKKLKDFLDSKNK